MQSIMHPRTFVRAVKAPASAPARPHAWRGTRGARYGGAAITMSTKE
jgi:hypothetical protein